MFENFTGFIHYLLFRQNIFYWNFGSYPQYVSLCISSIQSNVVARRITSNRLNTETLNQMIMEVLSRSSPEYQFTRVVKSPMDNFFHTLKKRGYLNNDGHYINKMGLDVDMVLNDWRKRSISNNLQDDIRRYGLKPENDLNSYFNDYRTF